MVKKIDDLDQVIDHIGVDLWMAAKGWQDHAHAEMVARGHTWYGDARSNVARHLDPRGLPQSELVARMGLSKQAVQQLLDALEADGIVARESNPEDKRSKRVVYTKKGLVAVRDAIAVKKQIEDHYRRRLGKLTFQTLRAALKTLAAEESSRAGGA